jgi:N-acetylmuramoyl-L-alanine amidase
VSARSRAISLPRSRPTARSVIVTSFHPSLPARRAVRGLETLAMLAVERLARKVTNRPRRNGSALGSGVRTPIRGTTDWFLMIATLATAGASLIVALGLIGVAATRSFDGGDARRPVAAFPVATSRPVLAPLRPATPTAVPTAIPDAAKVVCLDPGHGGDDLGAVREADGGMPEMRESTINLAMARNLAARLVDRGFEVVLTRETDSRVNPDNADVNGDGKVATGVTSTQLDDLQARINICNEARANLLLSLHINSSDNPLEKGYEVVYTADREFGDENQRLAQLIHDELGRQMAAAGYEATPRGIIDDITLPATKAICRTWCSPARTCRAPSVRA